MMDVANALYRTKFDAFQQKAFSIVNPGILYEYNWHIECIAEHLQALHDGDLGKKRLAINIPPRHLKTFEAAIAFPAWVMGNDPTKKFISTSFNFTLAKDMSQKSRILLESEWYQDCFKSTRIDDRQNEKHNFWTTERGFYYTSAIQSVTGRGADYVILDDPINPKEARSPTIRAEVNETISGTIPTRFNDLRNAKWIMIMQRLHDDDPTGRFALKDDRWHVLKLPAENKTTYPISYSLKGKTWTLEPQELLFPQRVTREILDDLRKDLGEYNYAGQMLQEPIPIGGGEFNVDWIQRYTQGGIKPREMNVVILVDPSGGEELNKKKKKQSDWTAMMVVGLASDNNYYLLDIIRDRLNPTERIDTLFMLHRKWNTLCGKPPKVGYEKYGMMTDTHYIKEKQKQETYNFPIIELGGSMAKEERIRRLIPDMQNGRWYFPQSMIYVDGEGRQFDLVKEILEGEMPTFPMARFDDMIDALSRIYEEDLYMIFPKPKIGSVQKAIKNSKRSQVKSWEDW